MWWHVPVVPATWEAEVGGCLSPGVRGCSEQRSHHCTAAWVQDKTLSQKTKQTKKQTWVDKWDFLRLKSIYTGKETSKSEERVCEMGENRVIHLISS